MKPVRLVRALGAAFLALVPACAQASHNSAPVFGPTASRATPPPAITGGTLTISHDGTTAIAADPDNDAVFVVDLASRGVRARVALAAGDEPFRAVEDDARRVFVVLRGGGAVATIDLARGTLVDRRAVCATPRGIAFQPTTGLLYVACASGELVTLAASGGPPVRNITLAQDDLRDVVVTTNGLLVSTFRSPSLLLVRDDGSVATVQVPHGLTTAAPGGDVQRFDPTVAWRTIATPGGGALMLHQRALSSVVTPDPVATGDTGSSGYGAASAPSGGTSRCSATAVHSTVTEFDSSATPSAATPPIIPMATLPVDLARASDGRLAVVAAANASVPRLPEVLVLAPQPPDASTTCAFPASTMRPAQGQATSVAFDSNDGLVVLTRAPTTLAFGDGTTLMLDATDVRDTGHEIFHANSGGFIACASCHPEGRDDAHTWTFDPGQPRRTMYLRGGLLQSAPFHWRGDLPDMTSLMGEVFVQRMGGPAATPAQSAAVGRWMDALASPRAPAASDAAAVERGRAVFDDPAVACASCHAGPLGTNNATVDVGTRGGAYQVPALRGLRWRAPYMHDGCADTLAQRFDGSPCGGTHHGNTAQLSSAQRDDLIAYLRTL